MLFDHTRTLKVFSGEENSSKELLKSLCGLADQVGELKQSFSDKFMKLVHALKWLDYKSLLELYQGADEICGTGKYGSYFLFGNMNLI